MKKPRGFRRLTQAETRRLHRELKQSWSTVPPYALARARELAGVKPGKEHEFRVALVKEQEGEQFIDYQLPVNLYLLKLTAAPTGMRSYNLSPSS